MDIKAKIGPRLKLKATKKCALQIRTMYGVGCTVYIKIKKETREQSKSDNFEKSLSNPYLAYVFLNHILILWYHEYMY